MSFLESDCEEGHSGSGVSGVWGGIKCFSDPAIGDYDFGNCNLSTTDILPVTADNYISIYPNPNNGKFQLQTENKNSIIEVYNIYGQLIRFSMTNDYAGNFIIDLSGEKKGIYCLKTTQSNGQSITKKICVQ